MHFSSVLNWYLDFQQTFHLKPNLELQFKQQNIHLFNKARAEVQDYTILGEFRGAELSFNVHSVNTVELVITAGPVLTQRQVRRRLRQKFSCIVTLKYHPITHLAARDSPANHGNRYEKPKLLRGGGRR